MSIETVDVLNLETGERGLIRRDWFENEKINNGILVEVDPDQKPYVADLFKAKVPGASADDDLEDDEIRPYRDDSIVVSVEDEQAAYDEFISNKTPDEENE